jgi:predicted AlkP superfamily phosphohydrolase/phosphomutase
MGLDAATLTLLNPWTAQGKLPNLQKLFERGPHGTLQSTIPPLTLPAWTSSYTGVSPAKHGIFAFVKPMPRRVYTLRDVKVKTLWKILDAHGKKTGLLHMPTTYPVEPLNGFMIAGLLTPQNARDYTYPPELREEIETVFPNYKLNVDASLIRAGFLDEFYHECLQHTKLQCQETLYLMQTKEWDLFYVVLHTIDTAQHFFWKFMDPQHAFYPGPNQYRDCILSCYQEIDASLGQILPRLEEDTHLLILSDHGAERLDKSFYLTNWLIKEGYVSLKQEGQLAFKRLLFSAGIRRERLVKRLKKWHLGWLPKLFPERLKDQVPRGRPNFRNLQANIDWSRTRAYFPSEGGRGLYLNVKGREPVGIVDPTAEYEALRQELIGRLKAMKDAKTGQPIFRAVLKREEVYPKTWAPGAPDLFLLSAPGYHITEGMGGDRLLAQGGREHSERSGTHHMDGIVVLYGPHARAGTQIQGAMIIDIAPTILYLLGLPVPMDMDGRVLTEAVAPDYLEQHPVTYDQVMMDDHDQEPHAYDEHQEAVVHERLRDLGYL